MKKLISLFSMLIVLSSNALPVLTYANSEAEELAKEILTEELENTGEHFSSEIEDLLEIEEFIGGNNNLQTLGTNNEYIVHNEENGLITIYTGDFSYGITIHDTDLDTNSSDDLLDYFKWGVNSPYNSGSIDSSYGSDFTGVFNNTARGGENDMKDYPYNYGYDIANNSVTNIENRKGPCPDGFHVPSVMEFTILFDLYYKGEYNFKNSYGGAVIIGQDGILNDLNFNYYGKHTTDNSSIIFSGNGGRLDEGYYWTSTPTSYSIFPNSSPSQWAYGISFYPNWNKNGFAIQPGNSYNKYEGLKVRCFKNEFIPHGKIVKYHANGGFFLGGEEIKELEYNYSGKGITPTYETQLSSLELEEILKLSNPGYEFLGWYEENSETPFDFENTLVTEDKTLYAKWKSLVEKSEENTNNNVTYTNNTTVTVGNETTEEVLSGSSTLKLVTEEVKQQEVMKEEDKTKVQESEIKVTSDKTVEYEGGLEVYLEKTEDVGLPTVSTGKVEGTIKFSAPVAVKIPIASDTEYVKVQVKHGTEEFGFKGLTLNPVNECNNGEAVNDKYNGEDVEVKENNNGEKYATIYTCSASTFVAYTESKKEMIPQPSAGGGRVLKNKVSNVEQEHNSADTEKDSNKENQSNQTTENKATSNASTTTESIESKVKKVEGKELTRGDVAVMTNILLEVYPQLIEKNKGLDDVTKACTSYTDEKDFTKEEKKAITRLCKLSIMGIKEEDKSALEEFMVSNNATNNEFATVVERTIENYNEKDLTVVKEALKKLENNEQSVVFGTLYDVFMNIKNIFN